MRWLAMAATTLVLLAPTAPAGARTDHVASRAERATNGDRASIVANFLDDLQPALDVPLGWTGSVRGCRPGAPSSAAQDATERALTYLRSLAGLDAVTLDPAMSSRAQQAALMMEAEGRLSHGPDPSWACYTPTGAAAAGQSNLYLGTTGADAIVGYMRDPGANNTAAGHRRWILNPETRTFGSGSTDNANALVVFGGPDGSTDPNATAPTWVPWPTAGYFPAPLEPDGRWSLSASDPYYSFDEATVKMVGPAGVVPTHAYAVENGYGPNTLVWGVDGLREPSVGHDVTYTVTVSGVTDDGQPVPSHSYDVTLVQPSRPFELTGAPVLPGLPRVGTRLRAGTGRWSPQPSSYRYRWYVDGVAVGSQPTYTPRPADLGRTINVKVTPERTFHTSVGAVATAARVVASGSAPAVMSPPRISGPTRVGRVLVASPGRWRPAVHRFTYQWLRGARPVRGATRSSYRTRRADRGARMRVVVSAVLPGHASGRATSPGTRPIG